MRVLSYLLLKLIIVIHIHFKVGRRMGKALIIAEARIKEPIITLNSDDIAEEMEIDSDEPAQKKSKGNQNDDNILLMNS